MSGRVLERFVCFQDVSENKTASGIASVLLNLVEDFCITEKVVAQTYDGAAVMSSNLNGVQSVVKAKLPTEVVFTHCYTHCLPGVQSLRTPLS